MLGKCILRFLAGVIDYLLIFVLAQMVLTVLGVEGLLYNLLPQLLFATYNIIAITTFEGRTIGKYFSKLFVYTEEGGALHLGVREVTKLLYFLPNVGFIFLIISLLVFIFKKKGLHDWIGGSDVLLEKERQNLESRDSYGDRLLR
ncbi:putative RDD family membrane protein YckC [Enterococcus sp. PF1-24]|uniref:RDD family protein n=1 Tax=unclassified Enterococcus TaxID=2608891 RepID=UPI0024754B46|nr:MULTISPECIES: RDD family protein [unclassified Enterococcus]MDH6365321.1 putative RDD family membrane protein YckC [Enterococcus sp. PFB1-1]MDH6402423.1 putative RDD family membrane protein YckC [Enterococcus sp. PF1-24]